MANSAPSRSRWRWRGAATSAPRRTDRRHEPGGDPSHDGAGRTARDRANADPRRA
jgi:hypothetical protein